MVEWVVIFGVPAALVVGGVALVWHHRSLAAVIGMVALVVPAAALARLVWLIFTLPGTESPAVNDFVLPAALVLVDLVGLWLWSSSRWPDESSTAARTAGFAFLSYSAVRAAQKRRDRERAVAVADELERRQQDG